VLAATGRPSAPGAAGFTGVGTLAVVPIARLAGLAQLDGLGTLATLTVPGAAGLAALSGDGTLSSTGMAGPAHPQVIIRSVVDRSRQLVLTDAGRTIELIPVERHLVVTSVARPTITDRSRTITITEKRP
jgi:hypothetical protein